MGKQFDQPLIRRAQLRWSAAAATALMAATAPHPSWAQARDPDRVEDIIVTARRHPEALTGLPLAVSVLDDQALRSRRIQNLNDLTRVTTSVSASQASSDANAPLGSSFRIRGLPGVVIYLNEVPIGRSDSVAPGLSTQNGLSPGQLYDLAGLEVLKGPQGTLFGRSAVGGAILLKPRLPDWEQGGFVEGTIGNYADRELAAALNLPIVDDRLAVRLAVQTQRRDGYTQELFENKGLDDIDFTAFRVGVLLRVSDQIENYTLVDHYQQDSNGSGNVVTFLRPGGLASLLYPGLPARFAEQQALGRRAVIGSSFQNVSRHRFTGLSNSTTWRVTEDLTVKNIASVRTYKQLSVFEFTPIGDGIFIQTAGAPGENTDWGHNQIQYTEELQVEGLTFDRRLRWRVGAFYLEDEPNGPSLTSSTTLGGTPFGGPSFFEFDYKSTSAAVFAHGELDLAFLHDGLAVSAGVRRTRDKRTSRARATSGTPMVRVNANGQAINCIGVFAVDTSCIQSAADVEYDFTGWNVALTQRFSDGLTGYVRSGRAYRPGGANLAAPAALSVYQPETLTDIEAGLRFRGSVNGATISADAAIFKARYDDVQINSTFSAADAQGRVRLLNLISNAAEGEIDGAELELALDTAFGLALEGRATFLDGEYSRYPLSLSPDGKWPFLFTPRQAYGLLATYRLPLPARFGELEAAADYAWHGSQQLAASPGEIFDVLPSRENLNLRLDWSDALRTGWDVGLWMTNVADRADPLGGLRTYQALGVSAVHYSAPRMFGLTLRRSFGAG